MNRAPLVARMIVAHPRLTGTMRGRYGAATAAATIGATALKLWPDLTMAEFAAGAAKARELVADQRAVERVVRVAGSSL